MNQTQCNEWEASGVLSISVWSEKNNQLIFITEKNQNWSLWNSSTLSLLSLTIKKLSTMQLKYVKREIHTNFINDSPLIILHESGLRMKTLLYLTIRLDACILLHDCNT